MCGISGIVGPGWSVQQLEMMIAAQHHRGPDHTGKYVSSDGAAALGHNRLSIIDLSDTGHQPMSNLDGILWLTFNGEIYNYQELRLELSEFPFKGRSDTEVLLAAYQRWGGSCLDQLIGMFAFAIWDQNEKSLFAARDRFGVKPLYYHLASDNTLYLASEIKAIHAAGVPKVVNPNIWATYLRFGVYEHSEETFWEGIYSLPAGHKLHWKDNILTVSEWYDLASHIGEIDKRPLDEITAEYLEMLGDSVRLRFRSDVPVGINVSGGIDSSILLGLVQKFQSDQGSVKAYTFTTGDPNYDETPWVKQLLAHTQHEFVECRMDVSDVPRLAESVQQFQDEPFGGLPTLAYARLFEYARSDGTIVLLDGQGMDEQWAGYDYYSGALRGETQISTVQGSRDKAVRPDCLMADFIPSTRPHYSEPFDDALRNLQYRDIKYTKIPRALRFNDRVSMRSSTELREPFLDHRLFEFALRQPANRKINMGQHKWLLRKIIKEFLPVNLTEAPKRPLQTPQREWLRGELRGWATDHIENTLALYGGTWLNPAAVRQNWNRFCRGESDNSFYVWQWISLSLMGQQNSI